LYFATKQGKRLGFIDKIEKTLEKKVSGLFSKTFKSGLEPVEIASAIKQEMDAKASILSRDRILVPNSYLVSLSPQDHQKLANLGEPLLDELKALASEHARKQGFQFGEVLEIKLTSLPSLVLGQLEVSSEAKKLDVAWIPVLQVAGVSHELTRSRTTVGRDSTADLQIPLGWLKGSCSRPWLHQWHYGGWQEDRPADYFLRHGVFGRPNRLLIQCDCEGQVSELALFLVRTGFLVLLWIFIFSIISVIRADLFGQKVVSRVAQANVPAVFSSPGAVGATPTQQLDQKATKLVVTGGDKVGTEIALSGRQLSIGRAGDSDLIVDDEYASTHHAKLVFINGEWLIQDLDSTNGTFLDGQKVSTPQPVAMNAQVRIGQTTFELRA